MDLDPTNIDGSAIVSTTPAPSSTIQPAEPRVWRFLPSPPPLGDLNLSLKYGF